jgi:hypothetical protein
VSDLTPEDTAAMRREGDLPGYMRSLIRRTATGKPATKPQAPGPPGRRPGTWPPGTRPPDPPEPIPAAEIQRALAEYRQWLDDGQPPGHYRCECTNCLQLEGENR